jgi:hypothetical protein
MKKYPAPAQPNDMKLNDAVADLELPADSNFLSLPPRIDPHVMLRRIEENLLWRSTRPGEQERRRTEKVAVEFVL